MFGFEKIKELEDKVTSLTKTMVKEIDRRNKQDEEIDKLYRIIKHHGDGPSYELQWSYNWLSHSNDAPKLYIYINDVEYVIVLEELPRTVPLDRDTIEFFKVSDAYNLVKFAIKNSDHTREYVFTIDYLKGTYVCSKHELESEVK